MNDSTLGGPAPLPAGLSIRPYQGGDEAGIVPCWNAAMPPDGIDLRLFTEKVLCDVNFDPEGCLVAVAAPSAGAAAPQPERIVGFCLGLVRRAPLSGTDVEPQTGWITAFGVDPAYRRQGVGGALFAAAEAFFRARGRRAVLFSPYAPHYFLPGLDSAAYPQAAAFLAAQGFRKLYTCAAMDKNIVGFTVPDDVRAVEAARVAEGYRFVPLSPAHLVEVARFADEKFSVDWGRAVREAVARGLSFDHFLLALDPAGRVVGFCLYGGYGGASDRFGPFGVDESQRGKGLGKVLLYQCLDAMRARGLHGAWFLWTGETSAAGRLYLRAGFTVTRRFDVLKKELA